MRETKTSEFEFRGGRPYTAESIMEADDLKQEAELISIKRSRKIETSINTVGDADPIHEEN